MAVERLGMPSILLMENAALNAAAAILDLLDQELELEPAEAKIVILCGGGNNGGDGFALARHLANWGATVELISSKSIDELEGDAATHARIARAMGLTITEPRCVEEVRAGGGWATFDIIVDAMLGTGFEGGHEVREPMATLIQQINHATEAGGDSPRPTVVSLDVPSGLDCDTGEAADATVRADVTVTFVGMKRGFLAPSAEPYVGRVLVADIGVPGWLVDEAMQGSDI